MSMLRQAALSLLLTAAVGLGFISQASAQAARSGAGLGVAWKQDLAQARAEAERTGKLVLIHFWTESCGPCKALDKRVFTVPGVAQALSAQYVPVKVNANTQQELAQLYGVTRVPTDVVIDSTGRVVKSLTSPTTPMAYVGTMAQLFASHRTKGQGLYDRVAQAAPAQPQLTAPSQPFTPVPQLPAASSQAQQSAVTPASATQGISQPAVANPAIDNPYLGKLAPQPGTSVPPVATPSAEQQQQVAVAQSAAAQSASTEPKTPAQEPSQALLPQLPAGSPPLGFEGYCPVTMKQQWQWKQGDTSWGAIHQGRTYLFVGEAERDQFLADPETYSPALSGVDPVMAVDENATVQGKRSYALEYRGKFYFFSSQQTLNKFWTNADGYADGAQRVASQVREAGSLIR